MRIYLRRRISGRTLSVLAFVHVCAFAHAGAQTLPPTYITETKFNSGQNVVPSFDGWVKNPDGSFNLIFGYMNRNYQEELYIPAGPDNKVEPGTIDQGQPTYFLTRRHQRLFQVRVPADWGEQKEVVWTIIAHGRTEKAYGTLQYQEELTPRELMGRDGISFTGEINPNQPPSISIAPVAPGSVGDPLTLTALVTDDGLPKPRAPRPAGAEPGPGRAETKIGIGVAQANGGGGRGARIGLNVTWMQYGGPAKVVFEKTDAIRVADGKAVTTARFSVPGKYVLRATASDGELSTTSNVTVTVQGK